MALASSLCGRAASLGEHQRRADRAIGRGVLADDVGRRCTIVAVILAGLAQLGVEQPWRWLTGRDLVVCLISVETVPQGRTFDRDAAANLEAGRNQAQAQNQAQQQGPDDGPETLHP